MDDRKVLLVVATDIEPAMEEEFNTWYNKEHIPELLSVPGVLSANRYMAVEGEPKYFTLYEHANERVRSQVEYRKVLETEWAMRIKPYLKNFRRILLKRI
jgi:hypothetical protein